MKLWTPKGSAEVLGEDARENPGGESSATSAPAGDHQDFTLHDIPRPTSSASSKSPVNGGAETEERAAEKDEGPSVDSSAARTDRADEAEKDEGPRVDSSAARTDGAACKDGRTLRAAARAARSFMASWMTQE